MPDPITRRTFVGGAAAAAGLAGLRGRALAQPALPKSPVALNIVDVAGNLALTQKAIENYRKAKPNLVSRITFTKAPAPELPGKIKAQQDASRVDIDLVLTGTDALSAGIDQKLWVELLPRIRRPAAEARRHLSAAAPTDAGARHGPGRRASTLLPVRPAARIHARQGQDAADDGRGAAAWAQARTRTASSMPGRPIPARAAPS